MFDARTALGLLLLAGLAACHATVLRAVPSKAADGIVATVEGRRAVIEIESASGIGAADVSLADGPRPEEILLRLRLKGLEMFALVAGEFELRAAVSSSPGHAVRQDAEPGDSGYLAIRRLPGVFEVEVPPAAVEKLLPSFTISWIDFFR